jgi:hypothetical protein
LLGVEFSEHVVVGVKILRISLTTVNWGSESTRQREREGIFFVTSSVASEYLKRLITLTVIAMTRVAPHEY